MFRNVSFSVQKSTCLLVLDGESAQAIGGSGLRAETDRGGYDGSFSAAHQAVCCEPASLSGRSRPCAASRRSRRIRWRPPSCWSARHYSTAAVTPGPWPPTNDYSASLRPTLGSIARAGSSARRRRQRARGSAVCAAALALAPSAVWAAYTALHAGSAITRTIATLRTEVSASWSSPSAPPIKTQIPGPGSG